MENHFEEYRYNDDYSELKNIAVALFGIAKELRGLGFGDAVGTHPGGLESISITMQEGFSQISESLSELFDSTNNKSE